MRHFKISIYTFNKEKEAMKQELIVINKPKVMEETLLESLEFKDMMFEIKTL